MPPRAGGDPVPVRREAAVLRITLHRPERRNAHGAELHDALAARDRRSWFGTATDLAAAHLVRTRAGVAGRLLSRRRTAHGSRLTARLHGHCVGAGIELPAFASRVVAAPDTRSGCPSRAWA